LRALPARRAGRPAGRAAADPDRGGYHRRDREALIGVREERSMSQHVVTRRTFLAGTGVAGLTLLGKGGILIPRPALAATAKVGTAAPAFTSTATTGASVSLASYRGKVVVLEWTNHECPYVKKHYETGNMQSL